MIKFIILYALGRKTLSPRSLFNLIKSYLIIYMMILPGFLTARSFEWTKSEPLDFTLNYWLVNSPATHDINGHLARIALVESLENYVQHTFGNTFIQFYSDEGQWVSSSRINGWAHISRNTFDSSENLYLLMLIREHVFFENGSGTHPIGQRC